MVRRGIEDEIAGKTTPSYSHNLCYEQGRREEKEYDKEAVLSGNKGGNRVVWLTYSEEKSANYEVNTKWGMTTSIRGGVHTSQRMGGVRVACKKQSKKTKANWKPSAEACNYIASQEATPFNRREVKLNDYVEI